MRSRRWRRSWSAASRRPAPLARRLGVRLSFHPGPFCLLASRNPGGHRERPLGTRLPRRDLRPHGLRRRLAPARRAHQHPCRRRRPRASRASARPCPGRAAWRATSSRSRTTRTSSASRRCCKLADVVPVVLDLHHHWVQSGGAYLEPDDPLDRPGAGVLARRAAGGAYQRLARGGLGRLRSGRPARLPGAARGRPRGPGPRRPFRHDVEPGGERPRRPATSSGPISRSRPKRRTTPPCRSPAISPTRSGPPSRRSDGGFGGVATG